MFSILLATLGLLIGGGAVSLLYLKWRGGVGHPGAVGAAWLGVVISIILWSLAFEAYIGVPFAVLTLMLIALALVLRGADVRALARFPDIARARAHAAPGLRWSGGVARTLSTVVAAPVVGAAFGSLIWMWTPAHAATRFFWAVFGFVLVFALVQVWGASARRPWRALILILVCGAAAAAPVIAGVFG